MPSCTSCGRQIFGWESHYYSSYAICSDCYRRRYGAGGKRLICTKCTKRISESEAVRKLGTTLCKQCYEKEMKRREEWVCASCKKDIKITEKKFKTPDGKTLCEDCARKSSISPRIGVSVKGKCTHCGARIQVGLSVGDKQLLCKNCAIEYMRRKEKGEEEEGIADRLKHLFGHDK